MSDNMFGTIINFFSIILGGIIGILLKKGIKQKYQDAIDKALGISLIILGLNGVISNMFKVNGNKLESSGELLLIVSLVLGVLIGEFIDIDARLLRLSKNIENKFKVSGFAQSFMSGTLIYCIGAMAIIGSLNDGLNGDSTVLLIKSLIDGITSIILAATLGIGVCFSSIPVLVYQGSISLLASYIQPIMTDILLGQICMVGYTLVILIGINFLKIINFKTANFLPALLIPIIFQLFI